MDKICKGVNYNENYADIPVACMNVVALIADFVHCEQQQVQYVVQYVTVCILTVFDKCISNTMWFLFRSLKEANSSNMLKTW